MTIFISHSSKDSAIYTALCLALDASNIDRWDQSTMSKAGSLATQLRDAIWSCPVCVFVATSRSVKSRWCLAEIGAFWGAGKKIFLFVAEPGLSDETLPPQFKGSLWTSNAKELIDALKKESNFSSIILDRPLNIFWLGHDLALTSRLINSKPIELENFRYELKQVIHHLDEIGLRAPKIRRSVLAILKTYKALTDISETDQRKISQYLYDITNEISNLVGDFHNRFRGYPDSEKSNQIDIEIENSDVILAEILPSGDLIVTES